MTSTRVHPLAGAAELRRAPPDLALLGAALALMAVAAAGTGAVSIAPAQVLAILADRLGLDLGVAFDPVQAGALLAIRLPRVALGALTGAALAVAGAALQGLFRNPLADPHLLGISSGGALGAAAATVLGVSLLPAAFAAAGAVLVPAGAFAGGLAVAAGVIWLASREGGGGTATLLLAGIAINAVCMAMVGLLVYLADDAQLRALTVWTLGSLGGATWGALAVCGPLMAAATLGCLSLAGPLDALILGEAEAGHLGVDVRGLRRGLVAWVALAVCAGVALTGLIGFVGLVVPHLYRLAAGPSHRRLLPASALLGATLMVGADLVARTVATPAEVPVGIVTALVGAPCFIALLAKGEGQPC